MKKIIILLIGGILFLVSFASAAHLDLDVNLTAYYSFDYKYEYQETPNVYGTDGANWINPLNLFDGNWNTEVEANVGGEGFIHQNYTPLSTSDDAFWLIEGEYTGKRNLSISLEDCFLYSNIQLREKNKGGAVMVDLGCFNRSGPNWITKSYEIFQPLNISDEAIWWRTVFYDSLNNFNASNSVWPYYGTNITGKNNKARHFDGDDYIPIPHDGELKEVSSLTISLWVNQTPRSNSAEDMYFDCGNVENSWFIRYDSQSNHIDMFFDNGTGWRSASNTVSIEDNKYHHILVIYNGTNGYLYVDGVKKGNIVTGITHTLRSGSTACEIGKFTAGTPDYMHGNIDEVAIWLNHTLNITQILALNKSKGYSFYPFEPCFNNWVNSSWTAWFNVSCKVNNTMEQTRNLTQYDSSYCDGHTNTTWYDSNYNFSCKYVDPNCLYTGGNFEPPLNTNCSDINYTLDGNVTLAGGLFTNIYFSYNMSDLWFCHNNSGYSVILNGTTRIGVNIT